MKIIIRKDIIEHLVKLSNTYHPEEICGVFTGRHKEDIYTVVNFHWIPNVSEGHEKWDYLMDPQAYFDVFMSTRNSHIDLVGMFHSHPKGHAVPSIIDISDAQISGENVPYVIFSPRYTEMKAWMLKEKVIREIKVMTDDKNPYSGIGRDRFLVNRPTKLACETRATG